ncbi:MAG: basic amino acid ABC transporter substrate-binding protein [Lachnospirales bacterium]
MKKFAKILSVMLTGVMCLGVVGCGEAKTENADATDATVTTVQEGKLIWGTNAAFEPYEYMEGNDVVGIDADIANAVAAKLGLEAQVENMEFDAIIPSVTSGKVDIGLAGMTVNPERLNNVNFSEPYVEAGQAIVVKEGSDIKSAADLAGKVVGVQRGTTGDEYVSDEANGVGVASVERYANGPDAAQALVTDKIDAVVIDNEPAKKLATNGLVKLDENLTSEQYAIAVAKENTQLLDEINNALKEMQESGELQAILDKYLAE